VAFEVENATARSTLPLLNRLVSRRFL